MITEDDYILINRYLTDELVGEEKNEFENRLEHDEALTEELILAQSMDVYLKKRKKINEGIDLVNDISRNRRQEKKMKIHRLYYKIAAAAAVLIIAISGVYLFNQSESNQHRLLSNTLGDSSVFNDAIKAYNRQDYESALPLLERAIAEKDNRDPDLLVAKGVAQLELEKFNAATETFNNLLENERLYANESNWYLGLIEFRQKKYSKAQLFWDEIDENSPYWKRSRAQLNTL